MIVKLKKLTLKNFKGIKEKEVIFSDKTNISGDNATGKTTIFDAYSWLLWGKDSLSRKDYEIKPYDENNNVIHNLESSVEGIFDIDGKETTFTRVFKEVWTKKRGSNNETFTGHTTDFFINEVPKKKKEYEERISEFVSEDEFNLLSNPKYFNEILDKKERRKILLSLVDKVEFSNLVEVNPDFKDLDLENYSLDELKAMAKSTCKKINDKLKEIPARIDELEATKIKDDFEELENKLIKIKDQIKVLDEKLAGTNNISEEIDEKYKIIADLKEKKSELLSEFEEKKRLKTREYEDRINELNSKISVIEFEIDNSQSSIERFKTDKMNDVLKKDQIEFKLNTTRKEYLEVYNKKFDGSLNCPTCGKEFDPEKKEEIIKHFNLDKSKKIEALSKEGEALNKELKEIKDRKQRIDQEITTLEKTIEKLNKSQEENKKNIDLCKKMIDGVSQVKINPTDESEIKDIENEISKVEDEISNMGKVDNSEILKQKEDLNKELEDINSKVSLKGLNEQLDSKISQYMEEEKKLSKEYEEKQRILYLCEEYTKTYTEMVSEKINNLFSYVEFKLFDTQINGGIQETAEATYKGVPYGSLNSAAQINAGLDVINSLSKYYKKEIPIFVDNAESVNELAETNSQLITLSVSKFKNIRVESL